MVMAKLHIICGNCGCNDDFEYKNYVNFCEVEGVDAGSSITCKNCSTIHSLNDNAELKEFTKPVKVKPLVWSRSMGAPCLCVAVTEFGLIRIEQGSVE